MRRENVEEEVKGKRERVRGGDKIWMKKQVKGTRGRERTYMYIVNIHKL